MTRRLTRQSWPEVGTWEIMYVFQLVFVSVSCDIAHHRRRVLVLPCRPRTVCLSVAGSVGVRAHCHMQWGHRRQAAKACEVCMPASVGVACAC